MIGEREIEALRHVSLELIHGLEVKLHDATAASTEQVVVVLSFEGTLVALSVTLARRFLKEPGVHQDGEHTINGGGVK